MNSADFPQEITPTSTTGARISTSMRKRLRILIMLQFTYAVFLFFVIFVCAMEEIDIYDRDLAAMCSLPFMSIALLLFPHLREI